MSYVVRLTLLAAFVCGLMFTPAHVTPAAAAAPDAAAPEIGYLWTLNFAFDSDFNGILTIDVGPWENGNLVAVKETSVSRVACRPVGDVTLSGGDAVFANGGYLTCTMDLAAIVRQNHGLHIDAVDDYGSIIMQTRINPALGSTPLAAPLFTHPDGTYGVTYPTTYAVDMAQRLWNGVGLMSQNFVGVTLGGWEEFEFYYGCSNAGPCTAAFQTSAMSANQPVVGGTRVNWSTGPVTFEIGRNGGDTFAGSMSYLIVDPGNSAH